MSKKSNTIEINGRRYDAVSGAPIGHAKTITVKHHAAAEKPIKPARRPAKSVKHHAQQRSHTLMRKAVKKPGATPKKQIKVQASTTAWAEQPATQVVPKLSFGNLDKRRLNRADSVKKSRLISHFSPKPLSYDAAPTGIAPLPVQPAPKAAFKAKGAPKTANPDSDVSDMFERAIEQATSHLEPAHKTHKKRRLHLTRKHAKHARA